MAYRTNKSWIHIQMFRIIIILGAILGAVAGAIAGDPAQGAKMGAAVGATAGGMQGLGARRRQRMVGRY